MKNPLSLEDQVVIVTGAGQGIGRGVAELAAELGAKVVVNDLNEDGVKETAEKIGSNARAIVGNVADPDFPEKLVKFSLDEFGDINGLVNNAGIVRAAMIHKMDRATWQQVIEADEGNMIPAEVLSGEKTHTFSWKDTLPLGQQQLLQTAPPDPPAD